MDTKTCIQMVLTVEVFALGDAVSIKLPSGLPLPKARVFAHGEAEIRM